MLSPARKSHQHRCHSVWGAFVVFSEKQTQESLTTPPLLCNLSFALGFGSLSPAWSGWKSCLRETGLERKGLICPGEAEARCLVGRREGGGSSRWTQVNPFPSPPHGHCMWLFLIPPEHRRRASPESRTWDLPCSLRGFWPHASECLSLCVQLFVTPWTVAHQAPLSMEFSRQQYWSGLPWPSPGDRTWVSCIVGRFFTVWTTREAHGKPVSSSTTWARPSFPPQTMLKALLAQSLHSKKLDKGQLGLDLPSLPPLTLVSVSWPSSEAHVFSSLVAGRTGLLPPAFLKTWWLEGRQNLSESPHLLCGSKQWCWFVLYKPLSNCVCLELKGKGSFSLMYHHRLQIWYMVCSWEEDSPFIRLFNEQRLCDGLSHAVITVQPPYSWAVLCSLARMQRGGCPPSFEDAGGPHAWEASSISSYPLWCHSLIIPRLQGFADENEHSETKTSHFKLVVQSLGHVWLCDPMGMPAHFHLEEYICSHCCILKQITNEDLLYSAGNSTQYSVITYMEKEFEKE